MVDEFISFVDISITSVYIKNSNNNNNKKIQAQKKQTTHFHLNTFNVVVGFLLF